MSTQNLKERFLEHNERALARAISLVEGGQEAGQSLLKAVRARGGKARIVGLTGSPGSGKSTLVDRLIGAVRERGQEVAVVAVDPTSPYSGGAILGDRIRMMRHHKDPGVFIRSMATRGHLGGLAAATLQVIALLDAYGFDYIFVENRGRRSSREVDIVQVADSTVLILNPGQGDGVQAFKAGIMEIADVFAINKADHDGTGRLKREIQAALDLGSWEEGVWRPPLQETVASEDKGSEELLAHLSEHYDYMEASGELEQRRRQRARFEISAIVTEQVRRRVEANEERYVEAVLKGDLSPAEVVDDLLGSRV